MARSPGTPPRNTPVTAARPLEAAEVARVVVQKQRVEDAPGRQAPETILHTAQHRPMRCAGEQRLGDAQPRAPQVRELDQIAAVLVAMREVAAQGYPHSSRARDSYGLAQPRDQLRRHVRRGAQPACRSRRRQLVVDGKRRHEGAAMKRHQGGIALGQEQPVLDGPRAGGDGGAQRRPAVRVDHEAPAMARRLIGDCTLSPRP